MDATSVAIGARVCASTANLLALYGLLEEASAWLQAKGVAQWNPPYPLERYRREIEAGHVWYWPGDSGPIATVTLLPDRPDYYPAGAWEDSQAAWYVCRFVVTRKLSGHGLGQQLLNQLERDAARAGIEALRIDVSSSNPFLERYYVAHRFLNRGSADIMGARALLLERPVRPLPTI